MTARPRAVRVSPLLRLGWRIHAWLYRVTGGRLGSRIGPWPALLLITRGRKSGTPRTVSLNYLTDDGRWIVTAGPERDRLWARVVATDASYAEYERRTSRRIPVVALERGPGDDG